MILFVQFSLKSHLNICSMDELLYCLHVDPSVYLTGVLLSSLTGCRHWRIHLESFHYNNQLTTPV